MIDPKLRQKGWKALLDLTVFDGGVSHSDEEDEIGFRTCCHVLSYHDHSSDCDFNNALTTFRQILEAADRESEVCLHTIHNR